jgi:hypothetical protein
MGFLSENSGGPSVYLTVGDDKNKKLVRPLGAKPQSLWVHKIQEVKTMGPNNQMITLRRFRHETCTATGRNGVGCYLCNTPDPLWHMLSKEEQTNKKGQRVDFPKTPIHILPVYEHTAAEVVVMRGGNQLFEEMDKWYDTQADRMKDLGRCDWQVWKTGQGKRTEYKSSRMDVSHFDVTPELIEKAKSVVAKALVDRNPTAPDILAKIINGDMDKPVDPVGLPETAAVPALPSPSTVSASVPTPTTLPPVVTPTVPKVEAPPVAPVTAAPGQAAGRNVVDEFSSWVSQQPEFSGMGAINVFIPAIREKVGHVEYHKLSAEQLTDLKTYLNGKLADMRAKK